MKNGLFLDFDGTLVDSITQLQGAYFEFMEGQGHLGSLAEFNELNGPPLHEIIAQLKDKYSLDLPFIELLSTYREIIESHGPSLSMRPGADRLILTAQSLSMSIAIVTSSPIDRVLRWIENNDLEHVFDFVIGAESTTLGKPHPDPYLLALRKLKIQAECAVAVEDSISGATSALRAGLTTVMVSHETVSFENPLLVEKKTLHDVAKYLQLGA